MWAAVTPAATAPMEAPGVDCLLSAGSIHSISYTLRRCVGPLRVCSPSSAVFSPARPLFGWERTQTCARPYKAQTRNVGHGRAWPWAEHAHTTGCRPSTPPHPGVVVPREGGVAPSGAGPRGKGGRPLLQRAQPPARVLVRRSAWVDPGAWSVFRFMKPANAFKILDVAQFGQLFKKS